jgi:hypothetical protein
MHHLVVQAMYWLCFALQGNQFDRVASSFTFSISVLHADVHVCSGCVWLTVGFVGRSAICHSVNECAVTAQSANHSMTEKNGGVCDCFMYLVVSSVHDGESWLLERDTKLWPEQSHAPYPGDVKGPLPWLQYQVPLSAFSCRSLTALNKVDFMVRVPRIKLLVSRHQLIGCSTMH